MQYQNENKIMLLAIYIAAASVFQIIESFLPHPIPYLRLGLANMVTLVAIITAGGIFGLKVAVGRTLLSSFITGSFLSPGFYLSFGGAVISSLVMSVLYRPLGKLTPIGVSIIGAASHNFSQLLIAYFMLIGHIGIIYIFPILIVASVAAGYINGYLAVKIVPKIAEFSQRKVFLVSGSPRRIDILRNAGVPYVVVLPETEEDRPLKGQTAKEYAMVQAKKKINSVIEKLPKNGAAIAADTVVELKGEIFVKPQDGDEAAYMLNKLGGEVQEVHTAVIVINLSNNTRYEKVITTKVKMKKLSKEDINRLKGKNIDKAGGYAIQGMKDEYIEWIKGSYANAAGFPVEAVRYFLSKVFMV